MEQISINVTVEEANLILNALGELPYSQVYQLINKVQAQASAQLKAKEMREQQLSQSLDED